MKFELNSTDQNSKARAGILSTDHGQIETPIFMPVGTSATVKGVHQRELKNDINPDIILGNTRNFRVMNIKTNIFVYNFFYMMVNTC